MPNDRIKRSSAIAKTAIIEVEIHAVLTGTEADTLESLLQSVSDNMNREKFEELCPNLADLLEALYKEIH